MTKEIEAILNAESEEIDFEEIVDPITSPINEPVVEKAANEATESPTNDGEEDIKRGNAPLDAEEQEINEDYEYSPEDDEEPIEIPDGHARQMADTILGMTNNLLAVGGGFFVKINKHEDFYEFDEVIQVIDEQNEKNVNRIKLDAEDQALLRPLIVALLKKKAKQLTPEQQLIGAIISIAIKKTQVVIQVRAENELLVERILNIVRDEKGEEAADDDGVSDAVVEEETAETSKV